MTSVGRCLAMTVGAVLLASVLFAAGVPGAVLLGVAPALLCVAMHLAMGHGDPDGRQLARLPCSAQHAKILPGSIE